MLKSGLNDNKLVTAATLVNAVAVGNVRNV